MRNRRSYIIYLITLFSVLLLGKTGQAYTPVIDIVGKAAAFVEREYSKGNRVLLDRQSEKSIHQKWINGGVPYISDDEEKELSKLVSNFNASSRDVELVVYAGRYYIEYAVGYIKEETALEQKLSDHLYKGSSAKKTINDVDVSVFASALYQQVQSRSAKKVMMLYLLDYVDVKGLVNGKLDYENKAYYGLLAKSFDSFERDQLFGELIAAYNKSGKKGLENSNNSKEPSRIDALKFGLYNISQIYNTIGDRYGDVRSVIGWLQGLKEEELSLLPLDERVKILKVLNSVTVYEQDALLPQTTLRNGVGGIDAIKKIINSTPELQRRELAHAVYTENLYRQENTSLLLLAESLEASYLSKEIDKRPVYFVELYSKISNSNDKEKFTEKITKNLSSVWDEDYTPVRVIADHRKVNENLYLSTCLGLIDNKIEFAVGVTKSLSAFPDCVDNTRRESKGSVPTILELESVDLILPAFISASVLNEKLKESVREFVSLNVGLFTPELLLPPGKIAKYLRFGKEKIPDGIEAGIGEGNILGSIVKSGHKVEYTNPAGKIIRWEEQLEQGISSSILSKKASSELGDIVEGKVGEFVQSKKRVEGFNQIYKRTDGTVAAELDIVTADEIIECKRNISLAKNKFTLDEQAAKISNSNNADFVNPYNKRKILYVDEPLPRDNNGSLFLSDKEYIDNLKANGIDFANSLEELQKLLK